MHYVLQPRDDEPELITRLRSSGRVHVAGLLADGAAALRDALLASERWNLVFNRGDQLYELDQATRDAMGEEKLAQLLGAVQREGRYDFEYLFENIRVPDDAASGSGVPALDAFSGFLNSAPFLAFVQRLVGRDDIVYVDCQATRFRPGHFLNEHDDDVAGKDRVAAYVLNLTHPWRPHWGGQLQFLADDGHVAEAFVPAFNALNLLRVPQRHLVSAVAPMADPSSPRLSLTGWLRRRRP